MKKIYVAPECELIILNEKDVIATSGEIEIPWSGTNDVTTPGIGGWC